MDFLKIHNDTQKVRLTAHFCIFINFLFPIIGQMYTLVISGIFGALLFFYLFFFNIKKIPKILLTFSFIFLSGYIVSFSNHFFDSGKLFLPFFVSQLGVAWAIFLTGLNRNFLLIIFYLSCAYFFYEIHGSSAPMDTSLDTFLSTGSRNHISIYFLNLVVLVGIANEINKEKHDFLPILLTFVVCFVSVGLGGILASFLLAVLYWYYVPTLKNIYKYGVLLSLFILVFIFSFIALDVISMLVNLNIIENDLYLKALHFFEGNKNIRLEIWKEYFLFLDVYRLLFGVNFNETFYGYSNLHSSYLLLHARMGLVAFILLSVIIFLLFRLFLFNKAYFSFLLVLMFRGITDTSFFVGGTYDFILLYLLIFGCSQPPIHSIEDKFKFHFLRP